MNTSRSNRQRFACALLAFTLGFSMVVPAPAQQNTSPRPLVTVELQADSLMKHDGMRTVELMGAGRSRLGTFHSVRLFDVLASLPELRGVDHRKLVVVCESSGGQVCTASFAELDTAITLSPLLLIGTSSGRAERDSFALGDARGSRGKVDLAMLEKQFGSVTRLRYMMNEVRLDKTEQKQFPASSMRLVFPYDRSTFRWLPDVRYIHVLTVQ